MVWLTLYKVMISSWPAFDTAAEATQVHELNTRIQGLRDLAPRMGAYVNEVRYDGSPVFGLVS